MYIRYLTTGIPLPNIKTCLTFGIFTINTYSVPNRGTSKSYCRGGNTCVSVKVYSDMEQRIRLCSYVPLHTYSLYLIPFLHSPCQVTERYLRKLHVSSLNYGTYYTVHLVQR